MPAMALQIIQADGAQSRCLMTPEEKAAADAASADAEATAKAEKEKADFDASLEGLSEEEKAAKIADKDKKVEKGIDYKAELAAERERTKTAEKALADKRFKDAEKKRKADLDDESDDADDDDKPVTRKELDAVRFETRREVQKERALEIAKTMSTSDDEAELIVAKWSNRSFPEGTTLSDQIEEAYAITHRKKLIGERNEALRALKNKDGVNRNAASSHKESAPGNEPKLSSQDEQAIKASGFSWNGTSRQFEKKLSNGDMLVRDSKTKQTRLIKKAK